MGLSEKWTKTNWNKYIVSERIPALWTRGCKGSVNKDHFGEHEAVDSQCPVLSSERHFNDSLNEIFEVRQVRASSPLRAKHRWRLSSLWIIVPLILPSYHLTENTNHMYSATSSVALQASSADFSLSRERLCIWLSTRICFKQKEL